MASIVPGDALQFGRDQQQQVGGRAPGAPQLRGAATKRTSPSPQQSPLQGQASLVPGTGGQQQPGGGMFGGDFSGFGVNIPGQQAPPPPGSGGGGFMAPGQTPASIMQGLQDGSMGVMGSPNIGGGQQPGGQGLMQGPMVSQQAPQQPGGMGAQGMPLQALNDIRAQHAGQDFGPAVAGPGQNFGLFGGGQGGGMMAPQGGQMQQQGGQQGFQVASPGREQIDPNDRGTRLTFEGFNLPQLTPERVRADQVNAQQVQAGQQGRVPGLDFEGFGLDPSQFGAGGQFDASGGGVGQGFQVNPQSVMENAMQAFRSQLPGLNLDLADETEGLAKKTSALGRTGSGLFNRDTDDLSDRARATRESLLGNLGFQGATTDAGNDLQAQIATGGFQQQGLNRLLQGRQSGAQNALQAAMTGANLNQQGQQFDIGNQINRDQFNIGNELQAAMQNQSADLQGQTANQGANLQAGMANQGAGMEAGQFNINNALQAAMEQMGLAERQQGREDNMAQQAQQNIFQQLGLLGQGFQGDPTQALQGLANTQLGAGQEFGANAGQINQGMGGMGNFVGDMLGQFMGQQGQGIPDAPAPIPTPQFDPNFDPMA